jgi:DNA-binding response OmpR family regulator
METRARPRPPKVRPAHCRRLLPNKDGWAVVGSFAKAGCAILFLTARDSVRDGKGLELGADDYLVTVRVSELLARVRSLLRRVPDRRRDCISAIWN